MVILCFDLLCYELGLFGKLLICAQSQKLKIQPNSSLNLVSVSRSREEFPTDTLNLQADQPIVVSANQCYTHINYFKPTSRDMNDTLNQQADRHIILSANESYTDMNNFEPTTTL